jgi:hypothetical protein
MVIRVVERSEKERCGNRGRKVAWCNKLKRFCNAPYEYETCHDYVPGKKMAFQKPLFFKLDVF